MRDKSRTEPFPLPPLMAVCIQAFPIEAYSLSGHLFFPIVPTCAVRETASLGQHMLERWEKMG